MGTLTETARRYRFSFIYLYYIKTHKLSFAYKVVTINSIKFYSTPCDFDNLVQNINKPQIKLLVICLITNYKHTILFTITYITLKLLKNTTNLKYSNFKKNSQCKSYDIPEIHLKSNDLKVILIYILSEITEESFSSRIFFTFLLIL